LHDWDAVKGVKRDRYQVRDKYHFLKKLAFDMHVRQVRSEPWENLVKLATSKVGELQTTNDAENFVSELVQNNNVLLQDQNGKWGLGHLQYQEYLTALEAKDNPRVQLAKYLKHGWWSSVLEMYADMTRDITVLVEHTIKSDTSAKLQEDVILLEQLADLLQRAPNTEQDAKAFVWKAIEMFNSVDRSFQQYDDNDLLRGVGRPR